MVKLDPDQGVYFPYTLAKAVFGDSIVRQQGGSFERKQIELTEIWMQAHDTESVERMASVATNLLKIGHGEKVDYEVKAPIQILRNAERLNRMFNFIMVGIASFSLVVGGIGIMNIMLATVLERTREIGVRRAMGARQLDIRNQFFIEAFAVTVTGGLLGIVMGLAIAKGVAVYAGWKTIVTVWSIVLSVGVSAAVGLAFGSYPAMRAARLDPVESLRYE